MGLVNRFAKGQGGEKGGLTERGWEKQIMPLPDQSPVNVGFGKSSSEHQRYACVAFPRLREHFFNLELVGYDA